MRSSIPRGGLAPSVFPRHLPYGPCARTDEAEGRGAVGGVSDMTFALARVPLSSYSGTFMDLQRERAPSPPVILPAPNVQTPCPSVIHTWASACTPGFCP